MSPNNKNNEDKQSNTNNNSNNINHNTNSPKAADTAHKYTTDSPNPNLHFNTMSQFSTSSLTDDVKEDDFNSNYTRICQWN